MRRWLKLVFLVTILVAVGTDRPTWAAENDQSKRVVLVELYTSQGCDMCPAAEKMLGELAERDRGIVPIAFHVDYFNDPWKDVFSDSLYSRRQMTYNQIYTKPKNAEYGLYYTPMMMIDGEQSINGRDMVGAESAIRRRPGPKTCRGDRHSACPGERRACGHGDRQRSEPVDRRRKVAALALRRASRGRRRHARSHGRECRQVPRRSFPGPRSQIRVHRT